MSNPALPNNIKININLNIDNPHVNFPQFRKFSLKKKNNNPLKFNFIFRTNTHKDELCIGRKIENNKVNLLNLSGISRNLF